MLFQDKLLPELAAHLATAASLRGAEWGPASAESLEWLEGATAKLDAVAAVRADHERRSAMLSGSGGSGGGLDPALLAADNVCIVPRAEQAAALDAAAAFAMELRAAIESLYNVCVA